MLTAREWWITESGDVVKVSEHALTRFIARSGCEFEAGLEQMLVNWFEKGEAVRQVGRAYLRALGRHPYSSYRRYADWILVAQSDTIMTIYPAEKDKWEPISNTSFVSAKKRKRRHHGAEIRGQRSEVRNHHRPAFGW